MFGMKLLIHPKLHRCNRWRLGVDKWSPHFIGYVALCQLDYEIELDFVLYLENGFIWMQ